MSDRELLEFNHEKYNIKNTPKSLKDILPLKKIKIRYHYANIA